MDDSLFTNRRPLLRRVGMSSLVNNTLPHPITNGLTRHKSGDDWATAGATGSMGSRRRTRYPPCECCPYGYHIDLDFVRFCETLAQGGGGDAASKQRRKERRRQRKSMEVLLGLESPPTWSSDKNVPQFLNEPINEGSIFEDEKHNHYSNNRSPDVHENHDHTKNWENHNQTNHWENHNHVNHRENHTNHRENHNHTNHRENHNHINRREISSPSPIRDELQKAVLDFEDTLQRSQNSTLKKRLDVASMENTFYLPPQEFQDLDLSGAPGTAGLSAAALQNIREQMAQSLERMKELEEQVKAIPVLQIQLSVLKDEKRKLMEKLQSSESKKIQNSDQNMINNNMNGSFNQKLELDSKSLLPEKTTPVKKAAMRDVSVSCVAMMRDVGVSHSESPVQTQEVGINHVPQHVTRDVGVSHTPPPVPTRDAATDHRELLEFINANTKLAPAKENVSLQKDMISLKNIIKTPELRDQSTLTDLLSKQIYTDTEMDTNINKAIKMFEKTYTHRLQKDRSDNCVSIGIQVTPPPAPLKIFENCDKGVQVVEEKSTRNAGVTCSPRTAEAQVLARPETHSIGVSEDTVDVFCEKCANRSDPPTNLNNNKLSLATLNIARSKSFDYGEKPKMRSVGCGPLLRLTGTKACDTADLFGRSKEIGVNTVKRKLVDASVGDSVQVSSVNICDKCSNTIKNFAKDILSQSRSGGEQLPPEPTPAPAPAPAPAVTVSRIPRPTTLPSLPSSPNKPKLLRQDTYTKHQLIPTTTISELKDKPTSKLHTPAGKRGSSSDDGSEDEHRLSGLYDTPLFQPIHNQLRRKAEPSKEMKAAMKVLNDSLLKSTSGNPPPQMKNAINIIQQEWFKVSSTASANPLDVEDYLDCLEEMSNRLLQYVVNMTDVSGNTAMHYAVSHGNFDVVSILLDSKVCNINQTNAAGYTCIMLVSLAQVRSETHRQVVKRLFQLADVNIRAKQHGQTALMLAVSHGRLDMVELLLQSGADVNIQDEDGSTALMCAAEHHHIEIVKLLLAQPDCDLTVRDYDGSTALNIAMEAGNRDIGVLLYAQEHFSRGSSPYTSLKHRRAKSTTPTPSLRTPTSPQPHSKQDHSF